MKKPSPSKKNKIKPLHQTYALSDVKYVSPDSRTTIPTEEGVEEAKDWVDTNKK